MPADPYQVLGVKKDASAEDIQKAYRRLAKKLHPDLNPGNKKAEEQFKEVSAAYALLSDPEKRARFDRGEIDASGTERPRQRFYRDFADSGGSPAYASDAGFADFAGGEDIFAEIFGRGGRGNFRVRGPDAHYRLEVDFLDAINGAKRQITLPDGEVLEVAIPPGTRDGQILRLRGKGQPGIGSGLFGPEFPQVDDARVRRQPVRRPFGRSSRRPRVRVGPRPPRVLNLRAAWQLPLAAQRSPPRLYDQLSHSGRSQEELSSRRRLQRLLLFRPRSPSVRPRSTSVRSVPGLVHTHALFRRECQSFLRDARLSCERGN